MAESVSASDSSDHFLNSLDPDKARDERPAIERFVTWFGNKRSLKELDGPMVEEYVNEHVDENVESKDSALEPIRAFLAYSARMTFTQGNLVPHLKMSNETELGSSSDPAPFESNRYQMTIEGVATLEQELSELKARRPEIAESLRTAMQDKDFRENAPLDAARDEQAHLEAHIRAIEDQLRHAVIIDTDSKSGRANVGSTVKVLHLESSREQTFQLVSPAEVDPNNGKISTESPFGLAILNHIRGDEVTVNAPAGPQQLRVLEVTG